jgi:hypothetical protein
MYCIGPEDGGSILLRIFVNFVSNVLLSTLFSNALNLSLFLEVNDQVSHPYMFV